MTMNEITIRYCQESPETFASSAYQWLQHPGRRFGYLTARVTDNNCYLLEALLLDTRNSEVTIFSSQLAENERGYTSLTQHLPAAHWSERYLGDMYGIRALGHPRWKSLLLHDDTWPLDFAPLAFNQKGNREPYHFLTVSGEGIHEIPVGPIHAGIIEPGHFRFSCAGEIITNLEIRLGYLHRGVEQRLTEMPWQRTRFLAESVTGDTAIGYALAHALAMEQLLNITAPSRAQALRTIALELERLANHIGDFGAMSGDVGYSAGAALFPPMRGAVLALCMLLTGNRRQRWYIKPGGVTRDLPDNRRIEFIDGLAQIERNIDELLPLVLENPGVIARMKGTGKLPPLLARDFGIVGPAARASGSHYDARNHFPHGFYPESSPASAIRSEGDVLARLQIRADEIYASFNIITQILATLPEGAVCQQCDDMILPAERVGLAIIEAWRGELIHWVTTDADGKIARYAIKDPSFNNWTGLAIAARGNLVADFPQCNKSFNLSYSGNDL